MSQDIQNTEPVGIVITQGTRPAVTTALLAYVWGPAPEIEIESDLAASKAA